ncbi:hypothetical protein COV88_00560 [Candidatus Saccharibacteria bacterium CG11_big_fil_rev_8_21_14_0_20_41_19]|nr:hypothetical protein [Candidatus Saccharibacteria bacterium]OIP86155.1 MAG: hypothetical protein AUK57_00035 [Candidatus Saccharibacteria bacterium CG2_30_41_52]PIQ70966.1 MAG: hypothetical protein COV88_00560 [Candidatus Saccharibacteria bacterium CG11_big_fil_rev_8_21_14_0_20_41_19]PIZ60490.1 MAG: hypothetical protein COY18_01395 [Candidatus Saccharibacteria bacterium CG_4_10_14_0_2_um_filter_41_11]PJC29424.1 MAG: hypothetical protein CO052_03460 [Candidatus Saccharibacteria bacterium CG_4
MQSHKVYNNLAVEISERLRGIGSRCDDINRALKLAAKTNVYGIRMFYYYNPTIIKLLAGNNFDSVYEEHFIKGKTNWFAIALKKQSH